ncbi:heme ABC transporter ATP-binding protein/permease CydC [Kistimonas asteriae]|uniref:heme ABC transporter ATP-binding protein/permease CydC n=1 Tax=Kistimonas asteriae TaxID=517724 RepID=UPI001BA8B48F|nr:cysteine/glutathione ABC transporter ATP-binding protein/permease CydC [Kistimonas asteriae]
MRELLPFLKLYRHHSLQMGLGIILAQVTLAASVGLLALSGWFITATAIAGLTLATAQVFNFFTPGAGVRGFSIVRTAGRYFERVVSHDATFKLLARLRVWFYGCVEPLAPAGLRRFRQADLLNRMVADIDALDNLYLRLLTPLICAILGVVGLIVLASLFSPAAVVPLAAVLLPALLLLPVLFYRLGNRAGQAVTEAKGQLRTRLHDYVAGQAELLIFGAEPTYRAAVEEEEAQLIGQQSILARVNGFAVALVTVLAGLTLVWLLWVTAAEVSTGVLAGPIMAMLALATLAAFEAIMPLPGAFQVLGQVKRSAARLNEVTRQTPMVSFPDENQKVPVVDGKGMAVTVTGLSFRYPGMIGDPVLAGFDLSVRAGERIAITGHTGCGKSTLLQLLSRDWNPDAGTMAIGDCPIERLSESTLRNVMAVMPQRIHVFSATLRDNLRIAHEQASDEALMTILCQVGLDRLTGGEDGLLDLWLGQGGVPLSGGEQRRLGLARVLLCDSPLLLLDEPTEGLDPDTEDRILQVLNDATHGKTLLMVTHRKAPLTLADRIVSL